MRLPLVSLPATLLLLTSCAGHPPAASSGSAGPKPGEATLPYIPSLDLTAMDRSVDPCADLYHYSCGGWQKQNPIPPDQTGWSVYGKLSLDNTVLLRSILEEADAHAAPTDPVSQEIGGFYGSCMDETTVEKRGANALSPQLEAIEGLKSVQELPPLLARLTLPFGRSILFSAGSSQDPDDSESVIADLDQGGLGLPDRDYYVKDDAHSKEVQARYREHVAKVFQLLGEGPEKAKEDAETVYRLETSLAKASWTRVERRNPYNLKHRMKPEELRKLYPAFDWDTYHRSMHYPPFQVVNVDAPAFYKEVNERLKAEPLATWKTYLRFHVADEYSAFLSKAFVEENFGFYRKYLRGAKEMEPRWKRCVRFTNYNLGEALGQAYVRKVFSPELKARTLEMVKRIEEAMGERIRGLPWMSPETKKEALAKLSGIRNKIGYPDKWRDYRSVVIAKDDFLGNVERAGAFEAQRQIDKIGKPVDHGEWDITPPTVDAYYNPQMNDINFPAGVLQPPLYDARMDDAPNYGDTGGTIGHELTHGFDDEGSQFDAKGNLKNWWTEADRKKFEERTKCVADQYSGYTMVDEVHVNGELTLGENVADLGGEILAWMAWREATKGLDLKPIDGLTPEQRFFVGFAQWDCANERPEDLRVRAITDPHSPPVTRINGVVVNMPEFAKAFSCKAGAPLFPAPEKVCRVW